MLFAATRTKHVALRFAGLVGKVVILDEVHAADIYMEQFVQEALWWLGQGSVPVILLSATLSPRQRRELVQAYVRGALNEPGLEVEDVLGTGGYPRVTSAWLARGPAGHDESYACTVGSTASWRPPRTVAVEVLDDAGDNPAAVLAPYLAEATRDGGCVLVLLNTVRRAQDTYRVLRDHVGGEVVLLHGRLSAEDRATLTHRLLTQLGAPTGQMSRPHRLVVVATQVAEQSFDVDVDLLITDIAPVDLLIQRAGRLHRHERPPDDRPVGLSSPRIVVTGLHRRPNAPPTINDSALAVYGESDRAPSRQGRNERTLYRAAAPLLRTAALVEAAAGGGGWTLPEEVPLLVSTAYGRDLVTPSAWHEVERMEVAAFHELQARRARRANPHRLIREGSRSASTLEGVHGRADSAADEGELLAAVRDGLRAVTVVLVERVGERFRSLGGRDLGMHGEGIHDDGALDAVIGGTVRLPTWPDLSQHVSRPGPELSEWQDHAWTKHMNVVVLDDGEAELGGYRIRYHRELGLLVDPVRGTPAQAGTT